MEQDGVERFLVYLARSRQNGVAYHRSGIWGDYALQTGEKVLRLLRNGT